ncbi:hypothetical protein Scep_019268 [Stephania cephalantha]|uniref:Uncharacterized protein n=1 Tax=Stephania cephalantha TaxID=152367 RepID=A0AAP0IAH1_9MAGN
MEDGNGKTTNKQGEDTANQQTITQEWRVKQSSNVENNNMEEFKPTKNKKKKKKNPIIVMLDDP